jgi:hypothetical protein
VPGSKDRPLASDQPDLNDSTAPADQPAPWSQADLRQRLERLPPGHPSSPRSANPSRIPPPDLRDPAQDDGGHPDDPRRQPDAVQRDYRSEVPRFSQAWADHVRRWPDDRVAATVDRSRDPAGSWRGDGNQYLGPEQHAQATDVIARVQRAEKTLSKDMTDAERDSPCGGRLAGMEFRLKGEERLKEKIAEVLKRVPDRSAEDVMRTIPDVIRYTFCFEAANYSDGYRDAKQRLEACEHRMVYSDNHWRDDPEYKGINTRWVTQDGQRFEVQFHTAESFHAKQHVTHGSYERLRNPSTGRSERLELESFQREVCAFITAPDEVESIPDYKEEGR